MQYKRATGLVSDLNHALLAPDEPAPPSLNDTSLYHLTLAVRLVRAHWEGETSTQRPHIPTERQVAELFLMLKVRTSRTPVTRRQGKAMMIVDAVGEELQAA